MSELRLDNYMVQHISFYWLHKQFFEVRDFFSRIENRIPFELQERLFFEIIRQRKLSRKMCLHKEVLVHAHKFHATSLNFYKYKIFLPSLTDLDRVFPTQSINIDTFQFLDSININYINITQNKNLMSHFKYNKVKLNFDLDFFLPILRNYLDSDDLDKCLVAGGYFTQYLTEDSFEERFIDFLNIFKARKDIDVYIQDDEEIVYRKYCKRFNIDSCLSNKDNDYKFQSFKLMINNIPFNFIFSNLKNPAFITLRTPLDMIYDFDFDIAQIFYSNKLDSVFMILTLFDFYDKFKDCLVCEWDLNMYDHDFNVVINFCNFNKQSLWFFQTKGQLRKYWMNESPYILDFIYKFLKTKFLRVLKYYFKGYYLEKNQDSLFKKLDFALFIH